MFSIALDSFSDSQNFFHAFKSLLVLYWVLPWFLLLQKFLNFDFIFASSFSSAGLKLVNVCSFSLTASFSSIWYYEQEQAYFFKSFVCNIFEDNCDNKIGLDACLDGKF